MLRGLEGRFYTDIDQVIQDLAHVTDPREAHVISRNLAKWRLNWSWERRD